jgi:RimJ/RimL family protein N-acetyltransferase
LGARRGYPISIIAGVVIAPIAGAASCDRSSIEATPFLSIVTARLRLRPLGAKDVDALAAVYLHPLVAHWIGSRTRKDVAREIEQQIEYQTSLGRSLWAVEERDTGGLIGDCGLQPLEHRGPEVELSYDLHPRVWGHGLATEAACAVMDEAFGALRIERVVAVVNPDHIASRRVLEKAGLRLSGTRDAYGESLLIYDARRDLRGAGT